MFAQDKMLKLVQKHLISNLTFLSLINQIKWQRREIFEKMKKMRSAATNETIAFRELCEFLDVNHFRSE